MKLIEVTSAFAEKEFLDVPSIIYRDDPNWIPHLDQDICSVFNKKKNKLYSLGGEVIRWVLKNDDGDLIGRIAAFINPKSFKTTEYTHGGVGFFECIHNKEASRVLLDAAQKWLSERKMQAMDGPINFGERNQWWGCLTEGFDSPTYQMNYNPPYYRELFEDFGFQVFFNQFVFHYPVDQPVAQKYYDKASRIDSDHAFRCEHVDVKNLKKYVEDFRTIYNMSWVKMDHHKDLTEAQANSIFRTIKPIMDQKTIWFAYYNDRPISFFIMIPDINQLFAKVGRNFNWWGKLKFLYYKKTIQIDRMIGVVFGVVPEHQGKGVEGAIITAAAKVIQPLKKYRHLEMNWVGDFNPKVINIVQNLGTTIIKRYITYRKVFDPSLPFFRSKILD